MRKAFLILLLFLIFSCSGCENDKEYIRSLAIENYVDDFHPINWLLRYYARAYYSMPEDLDEFMAFISDCKEKDSFFSEVEKMEGYDVLETISNTKILFASFVDSAFFFCQTMKQVVPSSVHLDCMLKNQTPILNRRQYMVQPFLRFFLHPASLFLTRIIR